MGAAEEQVGDDGDVLTQRQGGPLLSIVVPTYRERDNLAELVRRLDACLGTVAWEVVFVDDDSPDGTADIARGLAAADSRVRCLQRIGRRGLSSACVEGMLSCSAPFLAVMDADLQHDERILSSMLKTLRDEELDIVIGSRFVQGGGLGQWDRTRASISRLASTLSRLVVPTTLRDPMSGFFVIRREVFMASVRRLSALGFKILVDLFASSPRPLRFREVGYEFRARIAGESKLDNQVAWDFGMLLLDKLVGHLVPVRFIAFAAIGSLGILVHLAVLSALYKSTAVGFIAAQAVATFVAMVFNFSINNLITYRDRRLNGFDWLLGLVSFVIACSVGAIANVGVAGYLFSNDQDWLLAALAGIVVGAVWNYAVTAFYTWGQPRGKTAAAGSKR